VHWIADVSKIHALNFMGAHYHCSPQENAKPFAAALFYVCSAEQYKYVNALVLALLVLAFVSLSRSITGNAAAGVAAAFLFSTSNLLFSLVLGNTMLIYVMFMMWALAFYLAGQHRAAAIALFFAGLNRPDAWALAVVFAILYVVNYIKANGTGSLKQVITTALLPLLAPIAWMIFDLRSLGDVLGSVHQLKAYTEAHGVNLSNLLGLAHNLGTMAVKTSYGLPIVLLGGLVLMVGSIFGLPSRKTREVATMAGVVALFYIGSFIIGGAPLYPRFFIFPIALCYLAMCVLPIYTLRSSRVYGCLILALVCVFCFNGRIATLFIRSNEGAIFRTKATTLACNYVKSTPTADTIIVGTNEDSIALEVGEKVSHQLITGYEAARGIGKGRKVAYLVYTAGDYYDPDFLARFKLVRMIDGGLVSIYQMK